MTQPNPNIPQLGAPVAGGGLRLRSFGVGRLVLILPQREQTVTYDKEPKQEIVCDIAALDGGPLTFGGKANNKGGMESPDTMIVDAPWFGTGVAVGGNAILGALRNALPDARIGKAGTGIVGRLWQDASQRDAWKIKDPTPDEMAVAQRFIEALYAGTFVNPVPRQIAGPQAQQVQYGNMGGTAAPVANPQSAAPAWTPPVQSTYGQTVPAASAPVANPFAAAAAPIPAIPPAPPGTEAWWGAVTDAQRNQYLASLQPAGTVNGAAPGAYGY